MTNTETPGAMTQCPSCGHFNDQAGDALRIDAIRRVLTILDTEEGDRQHALETIEKIISAVGGLVIHVEVRDIYGMAKVYPADPTAHLLADLAGTRTFPPARSTRSALGYAIEVDPGPYRSLPREYDEAASAYGAQLAAERTHSTDSTAKHHISDCTPDYCGRRD